MMFKVRQGLTLQQIPKDPGIISSFLEWKQVLNIIEGHQPIDPLLWSSILENSKVLVVLGISSNAASVHENTPQLDKSCLEIIRGINLVHLLHLGGKRNEDVLVNRRSQISR
jgi:hypothetical protein